MMLTLSVNTSPILAIATAALLATGCGTDAKDSGDVPPPDLTPFEQSGWWKFPREIESQASHADTASSFFRSAFTRPIKFDKPAPRAAELTPQRDRALWMGVPWFIAMTKDLAAKPEWDEKDIRSARAIANFIARNPDAPRPALKIDSARRGRDHIRKLWKWFNAASKRRENYGAMIVTSDAGPCVGLPYEQDDLEVPRQVIELSAGLEVRTYSVDRKGVIQGVRDGEPIWTRRITSGIGKAYGPLGTLNAVEVGSYGWRLGG